MRADEIRSRLISSGLCAPEGIVGYSDEEIAEMERKANVAFPTQYREFLRAAGRRADGFFEGSVITGPELLRLSDYLTEMLDGGQETWRLPPNAFVFFMHQGYQFAFFVCDNNDDPPVTFYHEGEGSAERKVPTLSEFFLGSIQGLVAERERIERQISRE